jgi:hypothetical protein
VETRARESICDGGGSGCGVDQTKLDVLVTNAQGDRGEAIEVDLSYEFAFVTPIGDIIGFIGGNSFSAPTITAHSSMRLE